MSYSNSMEQTIALQYESQKTKENLAQVVNKATEQRDKRRKKNKSVLMGRSNNPVSNRPATAHQRKKSTALMSS